MDLGVGIVLQTNGFAAGPRLKTPTTFKARVQNVMKSLSIATPVLLIGLARFISTRAVNYTEHVTEYGVHWNFFMTLGLIPVLTAVMQLVVPFLPFGILAAIISLGYQKILNDGLADYIINAPRVSGDFFSLNREGICSFVGYFALFLIGASMGATIYSSSDENHSGGDGKGSLGSKAPTSTSKPKASLHEDLPGFINMATTCSVQWVLYYQSLALGIPVSRRMANLSYILLASASVSTSLSTLMATEIIFAVRHGPSKFQNRVYSRPYLFDCINQNQLAVFLFANLLTGLVNLSMDTLSVADGPAMGILLVYMIINCALVVVLNRMGWTVKLGAGGSKHKKELKGVESKKNQ
jgi:phosphatidylinositol glycan class W